MGCGRVQRIGRGWPNVWSNRADSAPAPRLAADRLERLQAEDDFLDPRGMGEPRGPRSGSTRSVGPCEQARVGSPTIRCRIGSDGRWADGGRAADHPGDGKVAPRES